MSTTDLPAELSRPIPQDDVDDLTNQLAARRLLDDPDEALAMLQAEKIPALAAYLGVTTDKLCPSCIELAKRTLPGFQTTASPANRPHSFLHSEMRAVIARMDEAVLAGATIKAAAAKEANRQRHTSAKTIARLYSSVGRPEMEYVLARIEMLAANDPNNTKLARYLNTIAKWRPSYFRDHELFTLARD